MKINSLKLHVEFDFDNVICKITDAERDISDEYQCYEPFGDCKETVASIRNFNKFVGDCVEAFLDDNNYCVDDNDDE